jgi:hypothetical protein
VWSRIYELCAVKYIFIIQIIHNVHVYDFSVLELAWGGKDCRSMSLKSMTLQRARDPYAASLLSALKFLAPA